MIETLGVFSVRAGEIMLSDNSPRSGQIWKLFKYIITNKETPIPTEKLIDILWPDGDLDNPLKALYSLIYRLRSMLKKHFGDDQEFIIFQHNSYIWNKNAPYHIDSDEFEALVKRAGDVSAPVEDRIEMYKKAFYLYRGDYLAESAQEAWALPPTNYYKRLYTDLVTKLADLCSSVGDYASVVKFCEKAIELDPYEENHHAALIEALLQLGQISQAIAHYDYIVSVLNKDLGVQPSERLQKLHSQIFRHTENVQYDLDSIRSSLMAQNPSESGAFFCDVDTFRKIYQLEQRALQRSGLSVYLACVSIANNDRTLPSNEELTPLMSHLKRALLIGLRRGDVVAQYSKTQFLMLLPSASYEDCERVLERVKKKFLSSSHNQKLAFISSFEPVIPS
ncbi:hypothetical protein LJC56_10025 [Christensenellaceae bacterium OttesenSCG-928-K19]|nr:hypothetical protein [Christensenellaceae bacterium OttesenSCG-928-K19]